MSHGNITFSVWYYVIIAIYVVIAIGAIAIIFDAMRAKRTQAFADLRRAGHKREPLWLYQVFSGLYLLVFILAQFPSTPHQFKAVAIFAIPVMIAFELAYLLRVVFPKYVTDEPAAPASDEVSEELVPEPSDLDPIEEISHDEHH